MPCIRSGLIVALTAVVPIGCNDPAIATLETSFVCRLPTDIGPCDADIPRWTYDAVSGRCVSFTYGGCGGNANNFESSDACVDACGGTPPPSLCGGPDGLPCGNDEYCDSPDPACGDPEQAGVCRPRPESCDEATPNPVCGCDGRTYDTPCDAHQQGIEIDREGACAGPPPTACTNPADAACGPLEFCEFDGEQCGADGNGGFCQPRPEACTDVFDPVCGCDGRTYSNQCYAQSAGVDIRFVGTCDSDNGTSVDVCTDADRSTLIQGASKTFSFCTHDCRFELSVLASPSSTSGECDVAQLEICNNVPNPACSIIVARLSSAGHERLRALAHDLEGASLKPPFACPDCADGGSATLDVVRDGASVKMLYPFFAPPAPLETAHEFVQSLIEDVRACRTTTWVTADSACEAR